MFSKDIVGGSAKSLLLLTFVGLILSTSCKTQKVQTHWSAEPVKVDGEMTEWTSGSTVYFEDSGVQLGLCNDSQNPYILFRFSTQAWARSIRMGGLTLWLDNSGKKKKDFGIRYTGGPSLSDLQKMRLSNEGGFQETLTPEQQQRLAEMEKTTVDQITVIDKKSNQELTLRADGSGGPAACFASPQGTYTYEFSIPLQKSDVSHYGIGAQSGQAICLGLEWGGINGRDRKRMMPEKVVVEWEEDPLVEAVCLLVVVVHLVAGEVGPDMQSSEKQEIWVKTLLALAPAK